MKNYKINSVVIIPSPARLRHSGGPTPLPKGDNWYLFSNFSKETNLISITT